MKTSSSSLEYICLHTNQVHSIPRASATRTLHISDSRLQIKAMMFNDKIQMLTVHDSEASYNKE